MGYVQVLCGAGLLLANAASSSEAEGARDRARLLGDWGGLRSAIEKAGIDTELVVTTEYFYNFDGGAGVGGDLRWDTSLYLELDTEAAEWWNDGEFFVHLQSQGGNGITEDHVGDFQVLSNIDADDFEQISEVWYRHRFASDRLWLKLGKMEANADFAFVEYGDEFINSSAGFSPTIPLVTYPDQDWGIVLGATLTSHVHVNLGVYQAENDGGRSVGNTIDELKGPKAFLEPSFSYEVGGKPGTMRIGAWWNGEDVESLDGSDETSRTWGVYATWDQLIIEDDEDQGIGIFAQLGFSSGDYYEAEAYYGAGLQWTGLIRSRDADVAGLGVFHIELSDEAGFPEHSETAIEFFYKLQVTPWISLKPDVQYILNPGGTNNANALVSGLRTEIVF